MSENDETDVSKIQWTPALFEQSYAKLSRRSGYSIAPNFTATNHGSWELVLSVHGVAPQKDWTPSRFADAYAKLIARSGFRYAPGWAPTNHGSWELALFVVS